MISKYLLQILFSCTYELIISVPVMVGGLLREARRDNVYLQFLAIMRYLYLVYPLVCESATPSDGYSQLLSQPGYHSAFRLDLVFPSARCQDIRNLVCHVQLVEVILNYLN